MSDEAAYVLKVIHDELRKQGEAVVGALELREDCVLAHQGNLVIQAEVLREAGDASSMAHCHVTARIVGSRGGSEPLDACVIGVASQRESALAKAGEKWVSNVSCCFFSLLHAKPVMQAAHFGGKDPWGVPDCHGFAGPLTGMFFEKAEAIGSLQGEGVFDCAAALAPPGIVHLAKVVLDAQGEKGWKRTVEIDGHEAVYEEERWNTKVAAPGRGIVTQYAMFHFADQQDVIEKRRRIDEAIEAFVLAFAELKDTDKSADILEKRGFDPGLANLVALMVPSACFRVIFGRSGLTFARDCVRVYKDGTNSVGKVMQEPIFARTMVLCGKFIPRGIVEAIKSLASLSAEMNAVNAALQGGSKLGDLQMLPSIFPDVGVSNAAMEKAFGLMKTFAKPAAAKGVEAKAKPWWKTW